MTTSIPTQIDEAKLEALVGSTVGELAAAVSGVLALLGDRLGLYQAMAKLGPLTPTELAKKTETQERYVREWLLNQAAGGYCEYDPKSGKYSLSPEQALALTDETSPAFVGGGFFGSRRWEARCPASSRPSRRGAGCCGAITTPISSSAPSASSVPATPPT